MNVWGTHLNKIFTEHIPCIKYMPEGTSAKEQVAGDWLI